MEFVPSVHNKEYLLANNKVLNYLVINSEDFASSKLASDPEILQQMILNARSPDWLSIDDLTLLSDSNGKNLAHYFAEQTNKFPPDHRSLTHLNLTDLPDGVAAGTSSNQRPNPEDLSLLSGNPVYPELQNEIDWSTSEKTKDLGLLGADVATSNQRPNPEDLSLLSGNQDEIDWSKKDLSNLAFRNEKNEIETNLPKTSVAHALAMRSAAWVNDSEFARSKKALYTLDQQGVSVAERMSSLSLDQIAMRFIAIGATFKISGPDSTRLAQQSGNDKNGITKEKIKLIAHETMDLVEESLDPLVGVTIGSAGYSTLHHLKSAMDNLSASPEKLKATNMTPQEIKSLINESERSLEMLQKVVIDKVHELRLNSDSSVKLQVNPFSEPAIQIIRDAISPKPNNSTSKNIEISNDTTLGSTFDFRPK